MSRGVSGQAVDCDVGLFSQVLRKLTKAYIRANEVQEGVALLFLHRGIHAFPELPGRFPVGPA